METAKKIIATLLILITWYLIFCLFEVEFNPLYWSMDGKVNFVWLTLGSELAYFIYRLKP